MSQYGKGYENLSRTKPLLRTVSNLKGVTNNLRMFADNFDQLLSSIENFAPQIEIVAKGSSKIAGIFAPRKPVRPAEKSKKGYQPEAQVEPMDEAAEEIAEVVEEIAEAEMAKVEEE
ncbi:MAG: hypothetical protein ACOWWO_13575 [Peptococcaceae bacterium]